MNKEYYVYYEQGSGCDYTIACGNVLKKLDATNIGDAIVETTQYIKENYYEGSDMQISKAKILESTQVDVIDIAGIYNEQKQERAYKKEEETRNKELADLERLKQKYENK